MPRITRRNAKSRVEVRTGSLVVTFLLLVAAVLDGGAAAAAQVASQLLQARVGNLILLAPSSEAVELDRLAAVAWIVLPRLEEDLGHRAAAPFRIYLLPHRGRLEPELAQLAASAPPWAAGFVDGSSRVGAIRLGALLRYPYDDTASVLAHEITHQVLYDAAGPLPRWLSEGIATWEGRRWGLRDFAMQSSALVAGKLPRLDRLDDEFLESSSRAQRAYAASFDFVSWSDRRYGPDFVPRLLRAVSSQPLDSDRTGDRTDIARWERAWVATTGGSLRSSEDRWRRSTLFFHRWLPLLASSGTLWLGVTALALLAGVARRRRTREIYKRWAAEESLWRVEEGEHQEPTGLRVPTPQPRNNFGAKPN